jgi:metabolite-proton symporter
VTAVEFRRLDRPAHRAPESRPRRAALAGLIGATLEWCDFFLYGSAAVLVFPRLFFPAFQPGTAALLAFATYSVGFAARPLGGLLFGHFGDRVGRRDMLVYTLLLMGTATVGMALLPSYEQVGTLAPALLVTLRLLQGLGLGGEWAGAVVMAFESAPSGRRGLAASWPQVGVPAGNLLATGMLWWMSGTLSSDSFLSWGWRVPFLMSGFLLVAGLWIRIAVAESPLFAEVKHHGAAARSPLVEVLRRHPRGLLVALGCRIGPDVLFYVSALYLITYLTTTMHLPREVALRAVLAGSVAEIVAIPLCGALSDRLGRRPVYLLGVLAALGSTAVFFRLVNTGDPVFICAAAVGAMASHGAMYGPQAALITELFPTRVRYSGASMGYQLAGVLGGALAPIVAITLVGRFGSTVPVALYVIGALAVSAVAVLAGGGAARAAGGRDRRADVRRGADMRRGAGVRRSADVRRHRVGAP